MDLDTAVPPQRDGLIPSQPNTSSASLYFDAMPSMSSIFSKPRAQSRSSSPERGTRPIISAPIPIDPMQNSKAILINGGTHIGDGEDDKTTLRADHSTHLGGIEPPPPQRLLPPVQTEGVVDVNRHGNDSAYDLSTPASVHKRSPSRSDERGGGGGGTDETSIRSVPVVYTNMVPEGEDPPVGNHSQVDVSRKVSMKRSPSKLVKRRGTGKGKQTENLATNGSVRGNNGTETRRSASRTSQRSFRSGRGPVFEMVTAPPNASMADVGGAFGTGAVMAAPEHEIEDELQSGFQERVTIAESGLTRRQTVKIKKEERTLARAVLIFVAPGCLRSGVQWRCRRGFPRSSSRKARPRRIRSGLRLGN